ncbi:MAG: hypothetical protein Tsb0020_01450 [Haliangiales bacterium]
MRFAHYTSWELDDSAYPLKCETNWEESNYWKQKLIQEHDLPTDVLVAQISATCPQLRDVLASALSLVNHGKYASELLKEFIFEDVRQKQFSTLPSRRQCIFLLEIENHGSAIHRFGFTSERPTAVEISVVNPDAVFLADASLLNCNLLKHAKIKEQAERYWSAERSSEPLLEYMYVGEFTIVGRL